MFKIKILMAVLEQQKMINKIFKNQLIEMINTLDKLEVKQTKYRIKSCLIKEV